MRSKMSMGLLIPIFLVTGLYCCAQQQYGPMKGDVEVDLGKYFRSEDASLIQKIEPTPVSATEVSLEEAIDPDKYLVGPNDGFVLGIWGYLNQSLPVNVTLEGTIIIPSVGEIPAAGRTLRDVKQEVIKKVKGRYYTSEVTFTLIKPRTINITVKGIANGLYPVSPVRRVSSLLLLIAKDTTLTLTGGKASILFSLRTIKLHRKSGEVLDIDLYKYFSTLDDRYNPYFHEGDVVILNKFDDYKFLSVRGAVQAEGLYEYRNGDDLETAIQLGRGFTNNANPDSIMISRVDETGHKMRNFVVKYDEYKNTPLVWGDRIYVLDHPDLRHDFKVYILGNVWRPGFYPITTNETRLSELIKMSGGFTSDAYLPLSFVSRKVEGIYGLPDSVDSYITLRLNDFINNRESEELFVADMLYKLDRVNVDFTRLFHQNDTTQDIFLKDEDIIFIGSNRKVVYVYGQVRNPGYIPLREGADCNYYIEQAGGLTELAEEDEMRVIKFKNREYIEPDIAKIESNDYIYVPKVIKRDFAYNLDVISKVAAVLLAVATLTTLIISIRQ